MALHENVWIVTGAAAPVIALANLVAINDSIGMSHALARARGVATHPYDIRNAKIATRSRKAVSGVAYSNLSLQAVMLFLALASLSVGYDIVAPLCAAVVEPMGLILLILAAIFADDMRLFGARVKLPDPADQAQIQ